MHTTYGLRIIDRDSRPIAMVYHCEDEMAMCLADAQLIAAAPQLLAALKMMLDAPPSGCVDHYAIEKLAREAVREAEEKQ